MGAKSTVWVSYTIVSSTLIPASASMISTMNSCTPPANAVSSWRITVDFQPICFARTSLPKSTYRVPRA